MKSNILLLAIVMVLFSSSCSKEVVEPELFPTKWVTIGETQSKELSNYCITLATQLKTGFTVDTVMGVDSLGKKKIISIVKTSVTIEKQRAKLISKCNEINLILRNQVLDYQEKNPDKIVKFKLVPSILFDYKVESNSYTSLVTAGCNDMSSIILDDISVKEKVYQVFTDAYSILEVSTEAYFQEVLQKLLGK